MLHSVMVPNLNMRKMKVSEIKKKKAQTNIDPLAVPGVLTVLSTLSGTLCHHLQSPELEFG